MDDTRKPQCPGPSHPFLVLPSELWTEIISYLETTSILSLSSTCGTLHSLLTERTTWILILRSVCQRDGVFFPSYDADTMDIRELRSAATGRYRWGRRLEETCLGPDEKGLSPPVLQPMSGPIKLPSTMTGAGADSNLSYGPALLLIAGGRYLVVADPYFLRLLDLGTPCKTPLLTPVEVAKVALNSPFEERQLLHLLGWEHDTGGLRIVVGMEPDSGVSYAANVYTVLPTEPNPEFRVVGSIVATSELLSEWWQIQVHQSLLYISSETSGGIVWAFEAGRFISVPAFQAQDVDYEVFTGDFIAQFMFDELHLWPVSSVHHKVPPHGQCHIPTVTETIPEEMRFPFPFRRSSPDVNTAFLNLVSSCQPHMSFPIALDVYPIDPNISNESWRYSVDVKSRDPDSPHSLEVSFSVKSTYALPSYLHNIDLINNQTPLDIGQSSRTLVGVYPKGGPVSLSVLSVINPQTLDPQSNHIAHGRRTGRNVALTILHLGRVADIAQLCSASGRFIYMELRGQSHDVFVVDYLSA